MGNDPRLGIHSSGGGAFWSAYRPVLYEQLSEPRCGAPAAKGPSRSSKINIMDRLTCNRVSENGHICVQQFPSSR
eukprot:4616130-Pyramimonas_sp.AAC.1